MHLRPVILQKSSSMVLVKKSKILYLFLLRKRNEENVFDDILERKKAPLDYK